MNRHEDGAWVDAVLSAISRACRVSLAGPVIRKRCPGGCIHQAEIWQPKRGPTFFIKSGPLTRADMFQKEAQGLRALALSRTIRTPGVLAEIELPDHDFAALVLEAIETCQPKFQDWRKFGSDLARLHQTATANRFGFDSNNYLGASPQINDWCVDWPTFFGEQRLHAQLRMAREKFGKTNSGSVTRRTERLIANLSQLLHKPPEPAVLLHGDLWSGNVLFDREGRAILIDPAPYYGDREAEWGMIELFGQFPGTFREGYQDTWPLLDGAEVRIGIYRLYHLLNHWNLFGNSYLLSCEDVLRELGY